MSDKRIMSLLFNLGLKRRDSKEDLEAFQSFVNRELDFDTIYSLIDKNINEECGALIVEFIFYAFSVKPDYQKIVEQLYGHVMNGIATTKVPENLKMRYINLLLLNLCNLSSEHLIKLINMCKKDIEHANENCIYSWKELIPQILKIISETEVLTVEGLEMTGVEYKEMIITDICSNKIKTNIIVPVAFMLGRTQLTEKEHNLVIKSLCLYFDKMKPQEIPPLLKQIIHFCLSEDYLVIFYSLKKYFDDKYIVFCNNEENNAFPIEDAEQKELLKAQNTVLYILEDFAIIHTLFVDAIIKYMMKSICAPNMVFGPFLFAFLVTLSHRTSFKANIIKVIKKLVAQLMLEVKSTQHSFWLKINCTNVFDVHREIEIFIKSSITSNEKVVNGLVNLGLSLMEEISVHKKNIINALHQLGMFILVTLVNKESFITERVLQTVADCIVCNPKLSHYIECLHLFCKNQKPVVVEKITEFLKLFGDISAGLSIHITSAILPVLKISTCIRDSVIRILHKELMSKDFQLRNDAVLGFVELLCNITLKDNFKSLRHCKNSQESTELFTKAILNQKSMDIYGTNDPENTLNNNSICLEIIYTLKICFSQNSEPKKILYRGLIRMMSNNSGLCVYLNTLFLNHMQSWCKSVSDNKKSLKFNKSIVEDKSNNLILHEPLEDLILLIQHIITVNIAYESNEETALKLQTLLDTLVNFYSECNIDEIKVNKKGSLLDVMSNISHYSDIVKQVLCVYQAFMVYIVNIWTSLAQNKECSEKLQNLFSKYNYIVEAIEASKKTNTNKDKKQKSETFICIEPAINLDFDDLYKFLSLLITNVNWASDVTVAPLKQNVKLWEFVLKLVQTHLNEIQSLILQGVKPPNMYGNLCKLSKLLYNHFLFNISENLEFSPVVLELGIECYLQVIKFVSSHYKKLDKFLSDSNQQTSTDGSEEIFSVLRNIRSYLDKVLEMNNIDDMFDDVQDKIDYDKIEGHLIGCVSVMCKSINQNHDAKVEKILIWLSTVIEKYSFSNSNNSKDFLTLILDMHVANQEDPIMLATLVKRLCFLLGDIKKSRKADQLQQKSLMFITDLNITTVCLVLCQYLCDELNYALLCLNRFKAELNASQRQINNTGQNWLKSIEFVICHRIILVTLTMIPLTKTMIPLGQCTQSVFNLLFHIYRTANVITKHFLVRSSFKEPVYKQALLEKLTEIINNQLTPNVSEFIMFVEQHIPLADKDEKYVQLRIQSRRQSYNIPKVITELELFVSLITKLGKKCKDQNLMDSVKLTLTPDFMPNEQKQQNLLSNHNNSEDSDEEEISPDGRSKAPKTVDDPPQKKRKFDSSASSSASSKSTSPVF